MFDDVLGIVIDNGTYSTKLGFSGDDSPKFEIPTLKNEIIHKGLKKGDQKKPKNNNYIKENTDFYIEKKLIEQKQIVDFDEMEKFWEYSFKEVLQIDPSEVIVLLTEPPLNPKKKREKAIQIMFETFNIQGYYTSLTSVLSLYSSGRTTGLILELGEDSIYSSAVYEGYSLPHTIQNFPFGSSHLTNYLSQKLEKLGTSYPQEIRQTISRDIKEKNCYVALDFKKESKEIKEKIVFNGFGSDDKNIPIKLGKELIECSEILFKPSIIGLEETPNIAEIMYNTNTKSDVSIRKDLCGNIILDGATSLLPGLVERTKEEFDYLIPIAIRSKFVRFDKNSISSWLGGSILSSLRTFGSMWITKWDYDNEGPAVVHRKCF